MPIKIAEDGQKKIPKELGQYAESLEISVMRDTVEKGIRWNNIDSFDIEDTFEEYSVYYEAIMDFDPEFIGGKFPMKKFILRDRDLSLYSKILIVCLWIALSRIIDNEIILPTVTSTINGLGKIISNPEFLNILGYSILRSLFGFIISLSIAIVMGVLSRFSKFIYNLMVPVVKFLSSTPTIAIIILALIWLSNEIVPLFVGFIMVFQYFMKQY